MSGGRIGDKIELQERDVRLLLSLFECRVLTRFQAALLHFEGRPDAAKKRLRALRLAGYLATRPRKPNEPAIFSLTRKAFEMLRASGQLQDYPPIRWEGVDRRLHLSPLTIDHELDVLDFRAAFAAAVRADPSLTITDFCTWPARIGFNSVRRDGSACTIKPDGSIRILQSRPDGTRADHFFFLEVDRSTESQPKLVERLQCYRDFYVRGGLAQRFGGVATDYKRYPFRVLLTCRSAERRDNLALRLLREMPKIGAQVWMTTMTEAVANPLGEIWVTARDVRQAGTVQMSRDGEVADQKAAVERLRKRQLFQQHVE